MIDVLEQQELEEVQEAKINSLEDVCKYLRKIAYLKKKSAENIELADAEKKRIEIWLDKENKAIESKIDYFKGLLQAYYTEQKAQNPKYRLSTPYGKVYSRKQQPQFVYEANQLIDWLKEKGYTEYISKVEAPKWGEFKETVKVDGNRIIDANGEVVDAVKVIPQPEKIEVITE